MSGNDSPEALLTKLKRCKLMVMDFDGVLTDDKVLVDQNGVESVTCSRSDGFGLEMLRMFTDVEGMILSRETNSVTSVRAAKLQIACISGCGRKSETLTQTVEEKNLSMEDVIYVGNDLNDIACMRIVDVSFAVADAAPEVLQAAKYVTAAKGGNGAVREVCDLILRAKNVNVSELLK